jgi:GNAT superfamily N-acetyltransferase
VLDRWQRRGVGSALLRAMLPRIADAGVKILHADAELGNEAVRRLPAAVLGPAGGVGAVQPWRLSARMVDGLLHYMMRVDGQW